MKETNSNRTKRCNGRATVRSFLAPFRAPLSLIVRRLRAVLRCRYIDKLSIMVIHTSRLSRIAAYTVLLLQLAGCGPQHNEEYRRLNQRLENSPIQVVSPRYDRKKNAIVGVLKNKTTKSFRRISVSFERWSLNSYDGQSNMWLDNINPDEARTFAEPLSGMPY